MELLDVYDLGQEAWVDALMFLYRVLQSRDTLVNISHRAMPSFDEHVKYVQSRPYAAWYIISAPSPAPTPTPTYIGTIYLTKQNEIGIFLMRCQGSGNGTAAVKMLMERHGEREYLANIAPHNLWSTAMFRNLGFTPIQITYRIDRA